MSLSKNAETVLAKRYYRKNDKGEIIEDFAKLCRRVARNISQAEKNYTTKDEIQKIEDQFYDALYNLEFLPNSPTLMNAGTELQQLSACFTIPINDSMDGIYDALKSSALVFKSGGGVGFSFTKLRPKNDIVDKTQGVSSGPISFMKVFNESIEQIKQGGKRRGAAMGSIRVDHPDILEFIDCKKDKSQLNNFNISICITDPFMKALERGKEYELINPRTKQVAGKLKAKEVFNKLVENAWLSGEPGILFIDRINKDNPTPELGEMLTTNPCLTGDTLIMTRQGYLSMINIIEAIEEGKTIEVLTHTGSWKKVSHFYRNGIQPVFGITLKDNSFIKATENHRFLVKGNWTEVSNLIEGDILDLPIIKEEKIEVDLPKIFPKPHTVFKEAFEKLPTKWTNDFSELVGLIIGDGYILGNEIDKRISITVNHIEDPDLENLVKEKLELYGGRKIRVTGNTQNSKDITIASASLFYLLEALDISKNKSKFKYIPKSLWNTSIEIKRAFLRGLFTADGSIGNQLLLSSTSIRLIQEVYLLLSQLGFSARIDTQKVSELKVFNTTYYDHISYQIVISGKMQLEKFYKEIGFCCKRKQELLKNNIDARIKDYTNNIKESYRKIKTIDLLPKEEVYDLVIEEDHSFIANNLISHNCGEIPLLPFEACNLLSINLTRMVKETGKDEYDVDWNKLKKTIKLSVRFLDNVVDMSKFPIPQITEMVKGNRKIGLGIMGFADLLILLEIKYNSKEGLRFADKLMKFIEEESKEASIELASIRGTFPNFKGSVYDTKGGLKVRNATTNTIAPTGTLSLIANCSGGIEPLFAIVIVKTVLGGSRLIEVNPIFEAILKKKNLYSDELMQKIANKNSIQDIEEIPNDMKEIFVTAHDIKAEWHVKMQAVFQKYVDNSISKTINLSHDSTYDDVKNIFLLAYEEGVKGITVYRDGSREDQVLSVGDKKKTEEKIMRERKISDDLEGKTHKIKTSQCGNLRLTVNKEPGDGVCEIICTMGQSGDCISSHQEAIGKLASHALRYGVPLKSIIKSLKGIGCPKPTLSEKGALSCLALAAIKIEEYSKEKVDVKKAGAVKCPECGAELTQGSCDKCNSCGWSSCGG